MTEGEGGKEYGDDCADFKGMGGREGGGVREGWGGGEGDYNTAFKGGVEL